MRRSDANTQDSAKHRTQLALVISAVVNQRLVGDLQVERIENLTNRAIKNRDQFSKGRLFSKFVNLAPITSSNHIRKTSLKRP